MSLEIRELYEVYARAKRIARMGSIQAGHCGPSSRQTGGLGGTTPATNYVIDAAGTNIRLTSASQSYMRLIRAATTNDSAVIFGPTAGSATNWLFGVLGASLSGNTAFHLYDHPAALSRLSVHTTGDVGIGTGTTTPSARLHVLSTTEQLRVTYDASNYYSTTVSSAGLVTFNAVGAGSAFTFSDQINPSASVIPTTN